MRRVHRDFLLLILILSGLVRAQISPDEVNRAAQYFKEARSIALEDHGQLWGVVLQNPMLFADPKTRMVIATENNREGTLTKEGDVYVGELPGNINIANTATEWAGIKWTMVRWPLPENKQDRAALMLHELWHSVQDRIGFLSVNPSNNHLDTPEGRIWLQLEWAALRTAVLGDTEKRKEAIRDALVFRQHRRGLFPTATKGECELEMHEGLAEYTGFRLSGRSDKELAKAIALHLEDAPKYETFVRSFAYASGPAYGYLLDRTDPGWQRDLKPSDDLGKLLQTVYLIQLPENIKDEADERSNKYYGSEIVEKEAQRDKIRQERIRLDRKKFVTGPVLILPLQKMNIQMDPANLQPLDSLGTVYRKVRVTDLWGILTVTDGALIDPTWTRILVPAPSILTGRPLRGEGWTLDLNDGWELKVGERMGDVILIKKKK